MAFTPDIDPQETQEWLEAIDAVLANEGTERAHFLLETLIDKARRSGAYLPYTATTAYVNTIPTHLQQRHPGNPDMERRIRALVRWNAIMTVLRANEKSPGVGGHIASFQSAATLYDVGFNHFFRAANDKFGGDLVFFQGHSSPGVYARAYLEGRINEEQLDNFRQETGGNGLSSYPHPWLMPDFWQFPTVSMGLGPLQGIYQARFLKYLHDRGIADTSDRKVWVFCGDGEMDEPESLGAISLASREKPSMMVDFATLTGSMVSALGDRYSGVLGNTPALLCKAVGAGTAVGERVCAFPFDDDYDEDLESSIADIKQCTLEGGADHVHATRFLSKFIENDTPWVHVDLSSYNRKGGLGAVASDVNGFGVALALNLIQAD